MHRLTTLGITLFASLLGPACSMAQPSDLRRGGASADDAHETMARNTPINVARTLPLGRMLSIEGTVTTPSGAFNSSFYDLGFAIQDRTAGIFISLPLVDTHLTVGQKVRVTGAIGDSNGLTLLVPLHPNDVQVLRGKGEVKPLAVVTGNINETTEGRLVVIHGTITQPVVADLPYGYKLVVDDGSGAITVFINLETGIDVSQYLPEQRVHVTGFSSEYAGHYEIDPRFPADIVVEATADQGRVNGEGHEHH